MHLTISGDEILLHIPLNDLQRMALAIVTPRQKKFMELWGAGKCNKDISAEMHISVRTCKWYASEIRRKMKPREAK